MSATITKTALITFAVADILRHDEKDGVGTLRVTSLIEKDVTDKITEDVSIKNKIQSDKTIEIPVLLSEPLMTEVLSQIVSHNEGGETYVPVTFRVSGGISYDSDAKLALSNVESFTIIEE